MPPKNLELTTAERLFIKHWKAHVAAYRKPPTQRWLADQLDCYVNSVQHLQKKLKEKGYLREKKITATRLELSAKASKAVA